MGKRVQKLALKNLASKVLNLGYVGENEHTQIVIDCSEVLWDYDEAVVSVVVQPPRGDMYPVEVTREDDSIIWEIADSDLVYSGTGRVQITFTNDGEVVKSAIGNTKIEPSIMATGTAPTPLENWMERAEETARQIAQDAADGVVDDLAEEKEAAIAEIQQAAEDARESIPEDYTQLSDDVAELKEQITNVAQGIYIETDSAPIVSISDGADDQPMRKVEVAIEPVQDLHGYEYPWPAGGGKNLLNWGNTTTTIRGVVFTVNADGTVNANGTASGGDASFYSSYPYDVAWKAGSYILNGAPSGSSTTYFLNETTKGASDTGNGVSFTLDSDQNIRVRIVVRDGVTVSNVLFKPMIRLATEADATFAPYSNICPISGWTGAKVARTGKNLFDYAKIKQPNQFFTVEGTTITKKDDTPLYVDLFNGTTGSGAVADNKGFLKAGTYTVSAIIEGSSSLRIYSLNNENKSAGVLLATITAQNQIATFTIDSDEYYTLRYGSKSGLIITNLQIEPGSTATAYEPYQGQTYEVTFPADPGTVYGGTLDVVSGKLVVDRVLLETTWGAGGSATEYDDRTRKRWALNPVHDTTQVASAMCNLATYQTGTAVEINHFGFHATQAYLYLSLAKDTDSATQIQVCYRIASPQEITLSPTEITTLLGENNLWADCGDSSVTYPADTKTYIDNRINATRKLIAGIETGLVASKAYSVGDMLIIGDDLYKVASSIASGATITVGTNVTKTTVAEQLLALMNA